MDANTLAGKKKKSGRSSGIEEVRLSKYKREERANLFATVGNNSPGQDTPEEENKA